MDPLLENIFGGSNTQDAKRLVKFMKFWIQGSRLNDAEENVRKTWEGQLSRDKDGCTPFTYVYYHGI